ncbi:neutral and basic amino acid transport protein rBAT-like [Acanthaster planci]|uniref:Neutral and basic amino acid transport protein rBAT-like n=1 Tax=Acanthaster planci TaxID=133434 RepID=A0A8B7YIJ1_ACAPL|nr:neutral and basic amino acid transport protein rBAT-like [Acanthaster planci]
MGDSRKANYEYEMAPTTDPEKADLEKGNVPEKPGQMQEEASSEWTGLGKEELLKVANTPAWNWTRNILLILFWVAWLAMLIAAIVIVVKVPRCPDVAWWEKNAVYQIFPRSFRDSNGDGVGDIKGIIQNLDYLDSIGIKILYLNSIFEQSNETTDIGYDIVNFTNVDPLLGNLTQFDELVVALLEKEMKLILEFVPNHSSDKHPWFVESKKGRDNKYSDYYVWANGTGGTGQDPPNNWQNAYGESAWTYVAERGQFYYHRFLSSQPDLNYYSEALNKTMLDAMDFWLNRKIDGFVFTNVEYVVEPQLYKNVLVAGDSTRRRRQADPTATSGVETPAAATPAAPAAPTPAAPAAATPAAPAAVTSTSGAAAGPMMTTGAAGGEPVGQPADQPTPAPEPEPASQTPGGDSNPYYRMSEDAIASEMLVKILKGWRSLLHTQSYLGKYRLMVTQSQYDVDLVIMQYGKNDSYLADYPFNLGLVEVLDGRLDGEKIMKAVDDFIEAKKMAGIESRWNTWALGSHDIKRIGSRVGETYVQALNMLLYTLPGTPITYYGEELGMEDIEIASFDDVVDPVARRFESKWMELSRDAERAPLLWNDSEFGNFTSGNSTWLPVLNRNISIAVQQKDEGSTLNQFSTLVEYHSKPSIVAGNFTKVVTSTSLISYVRAYPEWPFYLVAMNVGTDKVMENFHTADTTNVPETGTIVVSSSGKEGEISMDGLKLEPGEALLVEFPAA